MDHCGHRFGPDHPQMRSKMTEMNNFLLKLTQKDRLSDDTLLLLMGDHGMDTKGDHGGDSWFEVDAGLFLTSRTPFSSEHGQRIWNRLREQLNSINLGEKESQSGWYLDPWPSVSQIDLVPTISLLMGVPIPYGNLGRLIPQLFLSAPLNLNDDGKQSSVCSGERKEEMVVLVQLLDMVRLNTVQVIRYLVEYESLSGGSIVNRTDLDHWFHCLEARFASWDGKSCDVSMEEGEDVFLGYFKLLHAVVEQCRDAWARFSPTRMWFGIGQLIVSILYIATKEQSSLNLSPIVLATTSTGVIVFYIFYDWTIALSVAVTIAALMDLTWSSYYRSKQQRLDIRFFALFTIIHAAIFASNSFVVFEDRVVFHLAQAILFYILLKSVRWRSKEIWQFTNAWPVLILMLLTRITRESTICREEQQGRCHPTFYSSWSPIFSFLGSSLGSDVPGALLVYSLIAFFTIRSCRRQRPLSPSVRWCVSTVLILLLFYHVLDTATDELPHYHATKVWLARFAYLVVFGTLFWSWQGKNALDAIAIAFSLLVIVQLVPGAITLSIGFLSILIFHQWSQQCQRYNLREMENSLTVQFIEPGNYWDLVVLLGPALFFCNGTSSYLLIYTIPNWVYWVDFLSVYSLWDNGHSEQHRSMAPLCNSCKFITTTLQKQQPKVVSIYIDGIAMVCSASVGCCVGELYHDNAVTSSFDGVESICAAVHARWNRCGVDGLHLCHHEKLFLIRSIDLFLSRSLGFDMWLLNATSTVIKTTLL